MSLISCPECKHEISDKAHYCIYCGFPIEQMGQESLYFQDRNKECELSAIAAIYCGAGNVDANSARTANGIASWSVELLNVGAQKIKAVKITKELFHLDLAKAKMLVEQPRIIVAHNLTADSAFRIVEEYKIGGIDAQAIQEE